MSNQEYVIYDFKQAGAADENAVAFKRWISKSSQVVSDSWLELANGELKLTSHEIRTQPFETTLESIPKSSLGCHVDIENGKAILLWYVNLAELRKVLNVILNQENDEAIAERALTSNELALAKLLFQNVLQALGDSWPSQQSLPCSLQAMEPAPRRSRLFSSKELVTITSVTMEHELFEMKLHWVMPKREITEILESIADTRTPKSENSATDVVDKLPIEIVGLLGETNITMKRLNELNVGDIVLLDQKIDRPIVALIDGRPYYECWPGRVGNQQGMEIASCL